MEDMKVLEAMLEAARARKKALGDALEEVWKLHDELEQSYDEAVKAEHEVIERMLAVKAAEVAES